MKRPAQTAAEIYQVQPHYQRFNQKYNVTRQWHWNPPEMEKRKEREQHLLAHAERSALGLKNLALYVGSDTNLANTGFQINWPDQRGNSWQPVHHITKRVPRRWSGSSKEASRMVKRAAEFFGADLVGFCRLDRRWVYSHYFDEETRTEHPIRFSDEPGYEDCDAPTRLPDGTRVIPKEMEHVVALIFEMDELGVRAAPTLVETAATHAAYSRISFTTVMTAEFIRALGYSAIPSSNCTALSIPLAIDAGLGQLGRNAKLITPRFGPRCRVAKVITDLPLEPGRPVDFGVTEFCQTCRKCAENCPVHAIPHGERSFEPIDECNNRGVLQWQLQHKKCFDFWAKTGTDCGVCIRVCPFNKGRGRVHGVTRWFINHARWADSLIVKLDNALGYGRPIDPEEFWRRSSRA